MDLTPRGAALTRALRFCQPKSVAGARAMVAPFLAALDDEELRAALLAAGYDDAGASVVLGDTEG